MRELFIRLTSGVIYTVLLVCAHLKKETLVVLLLVFGIISLIEFSNLIKFKSYIQYFIFILLYGFCSYFFILNTININHEIFHILLVITIFVNLFLIKDLFTEKKIPLFEFKKIITTTFYFTSGFVFMLLIANNQNTFSPLLLLGSFILVWTNDSFAYLVGKNFGKQKLFPSISPKKTVEGFLGGLFFTCSSSYFIAKYFGVVEFSSWLILAIIISVFGTLGDLIESKFKRQANVKDSGAIMPGHGGLLDRLDSIIFAAPFIYLFLRFSNYVS